MSTVNVNFTGVNEVPTGEMLLLVENAVVKQSKGGNAMIALQCAIVDSEDGRWNGRKLFPMLLLETDMKRETFKALNAFGIDCPEGEVSFDTDELVGKETYVFTAAQKRQDGQGEMTQVKAWGIEPKALKASLIS